MLSFISRLTGAQPPEEFLLVQGRRLPLVTVRSLRARRYHLRMRENGSVRLTIPRRGSVAEGRRFAERSQDWIARQLEKLATRKVHPQSWSIGTTVLFRGEMVMLTAGAAEGWVKLGDQNIRLRGAVEDLRPIVSRHLWKLAAKELPPRTLELAALHQSAVTRVTVRNQRSRWGSCSQRGTISLNWRLIQTPPFVRDYIILHELMHLRQMNHSARFWREVEQVCPDYLQAEKWLKQNPGLLGGRG